MEEKINEQTETITQNENAAVKLGTESGSVSLGKFKDTDALLKAYNSLEAEFTKRCQRLKELESVAEKTQVSGELGITDIDKEEIVKGYLKSVALAKQKAIVMDGTGYAIKTPDVRPKSLAEAGEYAKKLFKE